MLAPTNIEIEYFHYRSVHKSNNDSTARKRPRGPMKNVWYAHIETSRYLDDVYVEAVY